MSDDEDRDVSAEILDKHGRELDRHSQNILAYFVENNLRRYEVMAILNLVESIAQADYHRNYYEELKGAESATHEGVDYIG